MPILSEDHVPLYYTIDIDDTHDIIDPHSDCIEAQSAPQAITRKSFLSYCFSWMKRSMNVSEADPKASSSQTDHASWPTDLHDHYKHLSHKPAQDLVDSMIRNLTVGPDSTNDWLDIPHLGTLNVSEDFKKFIDKSIVNALQQKPGKNLQICIYAPNSQRSPRYFSFSRKMLQSFRVSMNEMYKAPSKVLAHCVADSWEMDDLRDILAGHSPNNPRYIATRVPSQRYRAIDDIELSWIHRANFVLEWQKDVLKYTNDLSIYVWQPHLQRRPKGYRMVSVIVIPQTSSRESKDQRRMVLKLEPPEVKEIPSDAIPELIIHQFLQRYQQATPLLTSNHSWTATHEIFRTLMLLFGWMVDDTAKFVDSVIYELREMTIKGRMIPTRSKVQYLIHLDDCRRRAIEDLSHSLDLLDEMSKAIISSDFCCRETEDKKQASTAHSQAQSDIKFLRIRLHKLEQPIKSIREQVLEQMNLAQGQRTLILTIAAALFIPLSFVSGIFGMNLKQPLFPSAPPPKSILLTLSLTSKLTTTHTQYLGTTMNSVVETWVVSTGATTSWSTRPTATKSSTTPSATLSPTNSDNPHLFNMSRYLEIALPMTAAVIIVPLIIGPLVRFFLQTASHYSSYWRILCVIGALSYFGIVYGLLWPRLDFNVLFLGGLADFYLDWRFWYRCAFQTSCETTAMRSWKYALAYLLLVVSVLGFIVFYKLVHAYKGKRGRVKWSLFLVLVTLCLFFEIRFTWTLSRIHKGVPLSWIPFAILLFAWAWSERLYWFRPYKLRLARRRRRLEIQTI